MAVNDLKASIRAGKHLGWNEVVRQLLSDRTRMDIRARKAAGVIVLKRNEKGRSLAVLPLGKEKPFDQIAGCCRKTRGTARGPERALAISPVALVVVGADQKGEWAHELRTPDDPVVNQLLSEPGFANELKTLAYAWASDQIYRNMELDRLMNE